MEPEMFILYFHSHIVYSYPYQRGKAILLQEFEATRISRRSAREGDNVVNPTQRPPLPPGDIPGTHFC
jgi:hypothetical protein